jgi:GST-like protein
LNIQLYAFDTPNGRKISVALEEMGLPYDVHVVDLGKREQYDPAFTKISPNNKIPAIVDPHGPTGAPVSVFEWLMFQMGGFGPIPGQVHHFIAMQDETERGYGLKRFMAETRRLYAVMDRRLADNEYFAGKELTIADFAILGWAWRHPRHKVELADFPHVQRWYQALMARPGVQRGFAVPLRR